MSAPRKTNTDRLHDAEELIRIKNLELRDHLRTIKDLRVERDTAEKLRQEIFKLSAHPLDPPEWLTGKLSKPGARGGPMTIWSDFHYGEVVDPVQIGGVNKYNMDIAKTRFRRLVDTTVDLCKNHMGKAKAKYPGIVVCLGGDMIGGDIHEELLATNDRTPHQSVHDLTDLLGAGIESMASAFGRVFIPCVVGNHGRSTHRLPMKNRVFSNYDWSIYCNLERDFRRERRIQFLVSNGPDAHFSVYGHRYLLTHGDSLGVKGGDGIIGALGPIMRGTIKLNNSQTQIGKTFDTVIMGHWHQHITLPGLVVNNAFKGYDEYAMMGLRAKFSRPSQALWFTHPEHGITDHRQVFLEPKLDIVPKEEWISWKAA
jgi:hypothetical protein